jgi:hypothetical protein
MFDENKVHVGMQYRVLVGSYIAGKLVKKDTVLYAGFWGRLVMVPVYYHDTDSLTLDHENECPTTPKRILTLLHSRRMELIVPENSSKVNGVLP